MAAESVTVETNVSVSEEGVITLTAGSSAIGTFNFEIDSEMAARLAGELTAGAIASILKKRFRTTREEEK